MIERQTTDDQARALVDQVDHAFMDYEEVVHLQVALQCQEAGEVKPCSFEKGFKQTLS